MSDDIHEECRRLLLARIEEADYTIGNLEQEVSRLKATCDVMAKDMTTWAHDVAEMRSALVEAEGEALVLRKLILRSADACTNPGCRHCTWLGLELGMHDGRQIASLAAAAPTAARGEPVVIHKSHCQARQGKRCMCWTTPRRPSSRPTPQAQEGERW